MSDYDIPRLKWSAGGMLKDDKGGYVFHVDYDNVEIALRLAQAQNRELRQQLSTVAEALEAVEWEGNEKGSRCIECYNHETEGHTPSCKVGQALSAIKQNQGKQP